MSEKAKARDTVWMASHDLAEGYLKEASAEALVAIALWLTRSKKAKSKKAKPAWEKVTEGGFTFHHDVLGEIWVSSKQVNLYRGNTLIGEIVQDTNRFDAHPIWDRRVVRCIECKSFGEAAVKIFEEIAALEAGHA